MMHTANRGS